MLTFPAGRHEPAGDPAHFRLGQLLGGAQALVDRGLHHLGEHLGVLGIDRLGVDDDLAQGQVAAHLHLDHAAAGAGLDHLVLERLLRLQHLVLHLLRLFHQRIDVEAPGCTASSHLTDLLRVELALQLLHQRIVIDLVRRTLGRLSSGAAGSSSSST